MTGVIVPGRLALGLAATDPEAAAVILSRAIEDALSEATPGYWRRRAAALEAARPRPGDFPGRASEAELAERDRRLADAASACRRAAVLAETTRPWWVADLVREVA